MICIAAAALLVAGCKRGKSGSGDTIRIGGLVDLTGISANICKPYAEGLEGYVDWRNAGGGVNGRKIDFMMHDYGYKVDRAEQLYSQLVQEGVVAIQGWGTGDTEALRGKIAADKIPFMSASYSVNLLDMKAAPYNFLVGTSYSDQAVIALRWAMDDWKARGQTGLPRIAFLHHDSPFGKSPVPDAEAFAKRSGMPLTALPMPRTATDFVAELARVQQFNANYALIQNISGPTALLLKDARRQGVKDEITYICLNWCADELMVDLAEGAAEGVYGTLPFTPPTMPVPGHDEPARWLEQHGSSLKQHGLHYVQGWWTMAIMVSGIEQVLEDGKSLTGANIRAALEGMSTIDTGGVTAPLAFSPTSHKGNKSLRIFKVEGGAWQKVSDYIEATP